MPDLLTGLSPQAVVALIEANWFACVRYIWSAPTVELHEETGLGWYRSSLRSPLLNGVFRAHLAPGEAHSAIERMVRHFEPHDLPFGWWVWPGDRPTALSGALLAHGFGREEDEIGMAVDLAALPRAAPAPPELAVTPVSARDEMAVRLDVLARGFGFREDEQAAILELELSLGCSADSAYRRYIANIGGRPVAGASLFFGAGVAGLYNLAVVPEARGQGVGAALTLAVFDAARAAGYPIGILTASKMGASLYARLGFGAYCRIGQYLWRP